MLATVVVTKNQILAASAQLGSAIDDSTAATMKRPSAIVARPSSV